MRPPYISDESIKKFINDALHEDIRDGDITSLSSIPGDQTAEAQLIIKDTGILAGVEMALEIFQFVDKTLQVEVFIPDSTLVKNRDIAFKVEGNAINILSSERLVLNCMQRMSGIATYAHKLSELIKDTSAKVTDTRKTTPNFRMLEKWAVSIGGGINHRFGLFDQVLLKDNHVDIAGGITIAIQRAKDFLNRTGKEAKIEVETRNLDEVKEALACGVDIIMLDNMAQEDMKQAVQIIDHQCQVEASGGITEKNLHEIAKTGVDFISVGALTHSYKSLDMSLKTF